MFQEYLLILNIIYQNIFYVRLNQRGVLCPVVLVSSSPLVGEDDLSECPDLYPPLSGVSVHQRAVHGGVAPRHPAHTVSPRDEDDLPGAT